jgi:hypothetical protein
VNSVDEDFTSLHSIAINLQNLPWTNRTSIHWPGYFPMPSLVSFADLNSQTVSNSKIISSSSDFRDFQSDNRLNVELNGQNNFAAFSGFSSSSFVQSSIVKMSQATSNYHTFSIPFDSPNASIYSSDFILNIQSLPSLADYSQATSDDKAAYDNFIETYGTHVIVEVTAGLQYNLNGFQKSCTGVFDASFAVFLDAIVANFTSNYTTNATYEHSSITTNCSTRGGESSTCCSTSEICDTLSFINSATPQNLAALTIQSVRLGKIVSNIDRKKGDGVKYFIKLYMDDFSDPEYDDCKNIADLVDKSFKAATIALGVISGVIILAAIAYVVWRPP